MAEQKDPQDSKTTEAPQGKPAEEWGQREDDARIIASGGKESEKAQARPEHRP